MKKILPNFSKINFQNISKDRIKKYFSDCFLSLRYIPRILSRIEKIILIFLGLLICTSGFFIIYHRWLGSTQEIPAFGGVYEEGIVGEPKDIEKHIKRLTKAGLTKFDENKKITGDLAEKWEILDDGKTYKFTLRDGFYAQDLNAQIETQNIWPDIEIETPEEKVIIFRFKQPYGPFIYNTTEPIFNYGPYKISKEEKNQIILKEDENYWKGRPNIEKIIFNFYSNSEELEKAAKRGEIKGFLTQSAENLDSDNFRTLEMDIPRELVLFFNLSKADLQNVNRRRDLKEGKNINAKINLTLVTSENPKNVQAAEDLKKKWEPLGVNLEIKTIDNVALHKDIIPKREYDLLLYGLDYGADPDLYPFWHSSQIKEDGMNLSNFSSKKIDKLLEEARLTTDEKVRNEKNDEIKKILNEEVPFITLENEKCYYHVSADLKGIDEVYGSSEADRFLEVDDWFIKSKRVKKEE